MGIVFQTAHFVRSLTVGENLALARSLAGCSPDEAAIKTVLGELGLAHKWNAPVDALSVGEQQRVSIARAVVHGPGLILADEPTSALDDANTDAVLSPCCANKPSAQERHCSLSPTTSGSRTACPSTSN